MTELSPPPWLWMQQRLGPPPSYPNLKIPGVNAPIPPHCQLGYFAEGWGRYPVDEQGRPLYGDVFGTYVEEKEKRRIDPETVKLWGELPPVNEEEEEKKEREVEVEMEMEGDEEEGRGRGGEKSGDSGKRSADGCAAEKGSGRREGKPGEDAVHAAGGSGGERGNGTDAGDEEVCDTGEECVRKRVRVCDDDDGLFVGNRSESMN